MEPPPADPETYSISVIAGRKAILKVLPALEQAASAWEQQAVVQELPFYLAAPGKLPVLLLLTPRGRQSMEFQGAVFLYAFGHVLFGKRLLSNADRFGRVGVFGPADQRLSLAVAATKHLLETGSAVVRLSFTSESWSSSQRITENLSPLIEIQQAERTSEEWELLSRELFTDLTLHPDLNDTLSTLGRLTRRNIRDSMRKCVANLGCRFVPHPVISSAEFLALNRRSARPASSRVAQWRFEQYTHALAFVCGLQGAGGQWLCLAGGRTSADTVILEWQMNDLTYAKYSPSLLMRGYLMQYFGQQGMRCLFFEGGTSHHMAGHFNKRTVHLLRVRRPVLWLRLLQRTMTRWLPGKAMTKVLFGHG